MNPIQIIGGGIAGLTLGWLLSKRGIPLTVHEAGSYPRHRVCGEFISLHPMTLLEQSGWSHLFPEAQHLRSVSWWSPRRRLHHWQLPEPALGISRHLVDARLAQEVQRNGGVVLERSRLPKPEAQPHGTVLATGRHPNTGCWSGIKAHYSQLPLESDLEMHVGRGGYIGISRIEHGRANVCALVHKPRIKQRGQWLLELCQQLRLPALAERLAAAHLHVETECSVAGVGIGWQPTPKGTRALCLGDRAAVIAPATGHGMGMALEKAHHLAPLLASYATGKLDWLELQQQWSRSLRADFGSRLRVASWLQISLLHPVAFPLVSLLAGANLLPVQRLYLATRS